MQVKRPSLAESMRQAVRPEPEPVPPTVPVMPSEVPAARPVAGFYAATRVGKKKITAAVDPDVHKRLKKLSADRETTAEALLTEAIADLFTKYR